MDEDTIDYEGETVSIDTVYDVLDTAAVLAPKSSVGINKGNVSFRFDYADDAFGGLYFGDRVFSMGYVEGLGDKFEGYVENNQQPNVVGELEANEAVHGVRWNNDEEDELFVEFKENVDGSKKIEIPDGWSVKHVKFYSVLCPDMVLERNE